MEMSSHLNSDNRRFEFRIYWRRTSIELATVVKNCIALRLVVVAGVFLIGRFPSSRTVRNINRGSKSRENSISNELK